MEDQKIDQTLNLTKGGQGKSYRGAQANTLAKWNQFLASLREFKAHSGHCRVPARHKEGGYCLGYAVQRVRTKGCFLRGHPDRLHLLKNMGFVFKAHDHYWQNFLDALRAFARRSGHCCAPRRHIEAGYRLGMAVSNVRCRDGFIAKHPERRAILEEFGFVFDVDEAKWQEFVDALRAYAARTGHCRVPRAHREAKYNLGIAVNRVRSAGFLIGSNQGRRRLLERMGFVFDEYEARWQDVLKS